MPKFVVVHTMPKPVTAEEITPLVKQMLTHETRDAYWVEAWAQTDNEGKAHKIFCEWNAKNVEAVKKVFAKVPAFPVDGVYPLAKYDSESFR